MKNNLRLLRAMINIFGEDAFYDVSVDRFGYINCQGKSNSDIIRKAQSLKFKKREPDPSTYVHLERGRITIILTD